MKHELHGDAQESLPQHGGRGVILWGAFSAAGIVELLHCEKYFNALEYRRLLHNGLLPTNEKLLSKEE